MADTWPKDILDKMEVVADFLGENGYEILAEQVTYAYETNGGER